MSETRQRKTYDPTALERRWQERWAETGLYKTDEDESKPVELEDATHLA